MIKKFLFTKITVILLLYFYINPLFADKLSDVKSFAFALGVELNANTINILSEYDLIVIDGTDASKEQVATLHKRNSIVLGYLSAGTIEKHRPWSRKLLKKQFTLGYWKEWDEWFANVNKRKFRKFYIKKIAKPILKKHFDGLFIDNVDIISIFPRQTRGMKKILKQTRKLINRFIGQSGLLFIQNGDDIFHKIENATKIDGWNREDVTSTYNFDTNQYNLQLPITIQKNLNFIKFMINKGYFVTTTDYTNSDYSQEAIYSINNSCSVGAIPFVSDINLARLPTPPQKCNN